MLVLAAGRPGYKRAGNKVSEAGAPNDGQGQEGDTVGRVSFQATLLVASFPWFHSFTLQAVWQYGQYGSLKVREVWQNNGTPSRAQSATNGTVQVYR